MAANPTPQVPNLFSVEDGFSSIDPDAGGGNATARSYSSSPIAGYGGIVTLERAIVRKSSTGGTVDIYIGRWMGNSGQVTVTWDMLDGSRTVANTVDNYASLTKTVVFADGEYGWKKVNIPLQSWTLTDWEHVVFRINSVTIDNAEEFYSAATNVCYIRIDDEAVVNNSRLFCDKDHPSASDTNAGTPEAPFLTLQKLFDEMVSQNKSGYVVASSTVYEELRKVSGANRGGATFNRTTGGADYNDFIKLDGLTVAGERITTPFSGVPVFSNSFKDSESAGDYAAAIFVNAGSSMWVSDLELKNCRNGFQTNPGAAIYKLIAERVHSHGHVGAGNTAGFRWDNSVDSIMHNVLTHDIYENRSSNASNPYGDTVLISGTYSGEAVYAWHNGIQFYGSERTIFEFSEAYNISRLYGKEQRDVDGPLQQSVWLRNNYIHHITSSGYDIHNQGVSPGAKNALFAFNVLDNAYGLVETKDGSSTGNQADGVFVFNNSAVNVDALAQIKGSTGVRFADNIIWGSSSILGNVMPKAIMLLPGSGTHNTFIDFSKSNTFHSETQEFAVDKDGANEVAFTSLANYKTVYTDSPTPAASYMSENPEEGSDQIDPEFTNTSNGDFSRPYAQGDSIFGPSIRGAIVDNETVVGNY